MSGSRPLYREPAPWRDVAALLLSVLFHLLPPALGLIPALALRLLPKPPIEIEILPPKPKPKPKPVAAIAQPPVVPSTPRPQPKGPGAGHNAKPGPPIPPVKNVDLSKSRLAGLGPSAIDQDVGVRVLLRMPLIRQSPHRATVEALLHAFPDTHILAAGTKYATPLSPLGSPPASPPPGSRPPSGLMARALIEDVDTLLIETADPQDISATVFYAMPREGSELAARLAERRSPRWDTRALQTLRPDLLAFARPDLIGPVMPLAPSQDPTVAPPVPAPAPAPDAAWTEKLVAALRATGPAVYAEVFNMQQRFRLRNGLPTPVALRLALSADADPEILARVELANTDEAKQLLAQLPELQRQIGARLFWLGLGSLLSGLKFTERESAVEISGRFPRGDTAVALTWVRQFLPPPDRFLDPPPPPPPVPTAVPDLGAALDADADGGR